MKFSDDVAKLSIQNVKVISESYQIMEEINDSMGEYMIKYLKNYVDTKRKWKINDYIFNPVDWPERAGSPQVYYQLAWWGEEEFWPLHVAGIDGRGMGIALVIEPSLVKKIECSRIINNFFTENKTQLDTACLRALFEEKRKSLVFPMKTVSLETLAEAYPNWEDALEDPLKEMLKNLEKAHKTINTFVLSLK